jgi:hypothetical protein
MEVVAVALYSNTFYLCSICSSMNINFRFCVDLKFTMLFQTGCIKHMEKRGPL